MSDKTRTAAFIGGTLQFLPDASKSRDVVLAVPLSRVLTKFIRFSAADDSVDPLERASAELKPCSPYPDEELTVSLETVGEDAGGRTVFAAALPESAAEDIGMVVDEMKLNVVRIDALAIGAFRALWPRMSEKLPPSGRSVFLCNVAGETALFVFDGQVPVLAKSIAGEGCLINDVVLSLMEVEDGHGPAKVEAVFVSDVPPESLSSLAEVTDIGPVSVDEALAAVAERSAEEDALNLSPASWREVLAETRFKVKLRNRLVAAIGIWVLAMGVLFGVPAVYGFLGDQVTERIKRHRKAYEYVNEMKHKVELIRKYSDHANGALEVLWTVSGNLPDEGDGFVVTSYDFRRGESLRVSGEADDKSGIYDFKDRISSCGMFARVDSPSVKDTRGRNSFTLDAFFEEEDLPQ